jgi:hypothetical protein
MRHPRGHRFRLTRFCRLLAVKRWSRLAAAFFSFGVMSAGEVEKPAPALPSAPESLFKAYVWIESGMTGNVDLPNDRQNFGRLFDDRANEPLFNQASVTLERTLPPGASGFAWGFKAQFIYGSDTRFFHSLGLFDRTTDDIVQPDLTEAYLNLHVPVLTEGGLDLKLGKFVTLEGAETIDPRPNVFYSHSYIFNFGIPFNHTGALATLHANERLDFYAGLTRGVNTSLEDNNDALAFDGGIGFNLFDGKLTALASTHIGPETPDNNHDNRYLNDITIVAKPTAQLTSITDLNYIYDETANAAGYGIAQYFSYTINDLIAIGLRAEVWRDADSFYVVSFAENDDAADSLRGGDVTIDPRTVGGGATTYGAITLGLTIKPRLTKGAADLLIRPEVRYDRSLNGTHPFNDSTDRDQLTAGLDVVFSF